VKANMTKPVVGFIAGRTAPPGKRMGHAGAVISGGGDTAEAKMAAMRDAGIVVCDSPSTLGAAMKEMLSGRKPKALAPAPDRAPARAPAKGSARAAVKPAGKPAAKPVRQGKAAPKGAAGKKRSKR
jgi:succinyl-CoA synthetase alpha subunit